MVEAFLAEFREMQYPWALSGGQIYWTCNKPSQVSKESPLSYVTSVTGTLMTTST